MNIIDDQGNTLACFTIQQQYLFLYITCLLFNRMITFIMFVPLRNLTFLYWILGCNQKERNVQKLYHNKKVLTKCLSLSSVCNSVNFCLHPTDQGMLSTHFPMLHVPFQMNKNLLWLNSMPSPNYLYKNWLQSTMLTIKMKMKSIIDMNFTFQVVTMDLFVTLS